MRKLQLHHWILIGMALGAAVGLPLNLLAEQGTIDVALVTLPAARNDRSRARQAGFRAALQELGLPADPRLMLEMPPGLPSGAEAVVRLVEGAQADAIFFAGDVLAIGAHFECQRRGWAIPGRVALAAFDNFEILGQMVPPVTTLRLPRWLAIVITLAVVFSVGTLIVILVYNTLYSFILNIDEYLHSFIEGINALKEMFKEPGTGVQMDYGIEGFRDRV